MRRNIKQCSRGRSWSTPAGEFRWKRLGWPAGLVHAQHVTSWPIGQLLVIWVLVNCVTTPCPAERPVNVDVTDSDRSRRGRLTLMLLSLYYSLFASSTASARYNDPPSSNDCTWKTVCRRTASEIVRRWEAIRDAELIVDQCKPNRDTTEWKGADDVAVLNKTHPVLLQF